MYATLVARHSLLMPRVVSTQHFSIFVMYIIYTYLTMEQYKSCRQARQLLQDNITQFA